MENPTTNTNPAQGSSIKPVDPTPEVKLSKEEMVIVSIDRQMTDGGIRVNGKLYVGNVKVTKGQAED